MPKTHLHTSTNVSIDTLFSAFESAGIAFAIKNASLDYVAHTEAFCEIIGCPKTFKNDFDLFIPEVAYELGQEENQLLVAQDKQEIERILISNNGNKKIVRIKRNVFFEDGNTSPFISIVFEDITEASQNSQFDAMKQVLSDQDIFEKILNQFSNLIFRTEDRKEVMEGICRLCGDLLGLEDVAIYTLSDSGDLLQQAEYGRDGDLYYSEAGRFTIEKGTGICGYVAETKKPFISNNLENNEHYLRGVIDAKSEICIPIIYQGMLLGVLDSESTSINAFDEKIQNKLLSIVSLLAIKIHELDYISKLESKESILGSFVQSSNQAIAMFDKDMNFVMTSDKWIKEFGFGHKDVTGKHLLDIFPNYAKVGIKRIKKALTGKSISVKNQVRQGPDGNKYWINSELVPWFEGKEVKGVIVTVENVTETQEKLMKLDHSYEELNEARVLGNIHTWSFCPMRGHFEWKKGSQDLGAMLIDVEGADKIAQLIPDEYLDGFYQCIETAIEGKTSFEYIHPINAGDKQIWVLNKGKAMLDPETDEITCLSGNAIDITSEIDAENALKEKVKELEKVNSELDQFVYKTAHDLRAPLTNISGLINGMKNINDLDLIQSYLDLQEKSVKKLDNFILNISTFTKNARLPVSVEKLNIPILIDEILNDYLYVKNSDKVVKMVNVERGVEYYSDANRVETILRNVIDNAIRFADLEKEAPKLELHVKMQNDQINIKIEDNGLGIPDSISHRVFDMFYRGNSRSEGAGVGLYIANEAVQKLNGSIQLQSNENEGTTIVVNIPNLKPVK